MVNEPCNTYLDDDILGIFEFLALIFNLVISGIEGFIYHETILGVNHKDCCINLKSAFEH